MWLFTIFYYCYFLGLFFQHFDSLGEQLGVIDLVLVWSKNFEIRKRKWVHIKWNYTSTICLEEWHQQFHQCCLVNTKFILRLYFKNNYILFYLGKKIDGIWHTSIVVYNREYFFGSRGVESCNPVSINNKLTAKKLCI